MQVESSTTPLLTIDEANEDTISAFEETDAAVDLRRTRTAYVSS